MTTIPMPTDALVAHLDDAVAELNNAYDTVDGQETDLHKLRDQAEFARNELITLIQKIDEFLDQ